MTLKRTLPSPTADREISRLLGTRMETVQTRRGWCKGRPGTCVTATPEAWRIFPSPTADQETSHSSGKPRFRRNKSSRKRSEEGQLCDIGRRKELTGGDWRGDQVEALPPSCGHSTRKRP
jgi:hypothetical protein